MTDPACRECGHAAKPAGRVRMWVDRLWRIPPACPTSVHDESGWDAPCGCEDAAHAR